MSDWGRSDSGRSDSGRNTPGEPSLDEILRSEAFIEALSTGRQAAAQDHGDAALAALLGGWRDGTRWPPDAGLISETQAVAALNAGLAQKPGRERPDRPDTVARNRRGLSVVGAAAAAVLAVGGFGAVVSGSGPGDALYGLRTMMFGASKQVRDDQVALAARTELQQVQELISQGDWQQAQEKLVAVSTQVAAVGDEDQKQELLTQFNDLSAKVVERNPEATAPPGIVYTVPPSAAELVPALAPPAEATTTSDSPPTSTAPTSTAPSSAAPTSTAPSSTPSGSETSGTSSPTPSPSSSPTSSPASAAETSAPPASAAETSAPPAATSTVPSAAAATTSAAVPATTTAPAAPQSTTTPAAPQSTAATTAPAAPQSTAATSTPPAAAATTTIAEPATTAAPQQTATQQTATQQTATQQTQPPAAPTTTVVPVPEPVG